MKEIDNAIQLQILSILRANTDKEPAYVINLIRKNFPDMDTETISMYINNILVNTQV